MTSGGTAAAHHTSADVLEVVVRVSVGLGIANDYRRYVNSKTVIYCALLNSFLIILVKSSMHVYIHGSVVVLGGHASMHVASAVHPVPATYLVWFPQQAGMEWPLRQVQ